MSGKHRMVSEPVRNADAPDLGRPIHHDGKQATWQRTARRSAGAVLFPATLAVAFAGFSAAVLVSHAGADQAMEQPQPQAFTATQAAPQVSAPLSQPVSQLGTVVAVSDDSITTRSADGDLQTYRITPDTTAVTAVGGQPFTTTTPFEVNDEVAVHATLTGEDATATAVADRTVIGEHGRPMDSL